MNKRVLLFILIGSAPLSLFGMRRIKEGLGKIGILKPKEQLSPSYLLKLPVELRAEVVKQHLMSTLEEYEKALAPRERRTQSVLIELDALLDLLEPIIAQEALATPAVFGAIVDAFKEVYPSLERAYITAEMAEKFKNNPYFTKVFSKWIEEGAGKKGMTSEEEALLAAIPKYLQSYLPEGQEYTVAKDFGRVHLALESFIRGTAKKPVTVAYVERIIALIKPYFPDYPEAGLVDALRKWFRKENYVNFNKALDAWTKDQQKKAQALIKS